MKKLHRAWKVCIGCAILFFCTSGLVTNAFSIYLPYILSLDGFTNTRISTLLTVRSLAGFIALFATGLYYRVLSLKKGMLLSMIMVAAGFLVYGFAGPNYPLYLLGALLTGFGYGFGSMAAIGVILDNWFETDLPVATGICGSVTGLSTLGIPTLITVLIGRIGLGNTFRLEALAILLITLLCRRLILSDPSGTGDVPFSRGQKSGEASALSAVRPSYRPVLTKKLWLIMMPATFILGGYTATAYSNLSVLMTGEGLSISAAALVILVSGLSVTASKLLYGFASERFSTYKCNWVFGALTVSGLILCQFTAGQAFPMGLSIVIYSAGLGMTTIGPVVWARELSSHEDFEFNNRLFQIGFVGGTLLLSPFPGIIADRSGGSYLPAFLCFTVGAVLVTLIIQAVYRRAQDSAQPRQRP